MNKTELVAAVAAKSGISKKDADKAVAAVLDTIVESIANGEKVALVGFGTFEQRTRNARTGSRSAMSLRSQSMKWNSRSWMLQSSFGYSRNVTVNMIIAVSRSLVNSIRQRKSFIIISFPERESISRLGGPSSE